MNKNTTILILVIIIAIFGYLLLNKKQTISNQPVAVLTQQEAESLVTANWGGYVPGEGASFNVTIKNNNDGTYTVAAIYGGADDSVSKSKKEAIAVYENNSWKLGQPTSTQSCWPGRGHQDFSTEPCI